jgi:hypothetical protein
MSVVLALGGLNLARLHILKSSRNSSKSFRIFLDGIGLELSRCKQLSNNLIRFGCEISIFLAPFHFYTHGEFVIENGIPAG